MMLLKVGALIVTIAMVASQQSKSFSGKIDHCLKRCNGMWHACISGCGPYLSSCESCSSIADGCRASCLSTKRRMMLQLKSKKTIKNLPDQAGSEPNIKLTDKIEVEAERVPPLMNEVDEVSFPPAIKDVEVVTTPVKDSGRKSKEASLNGVGHRIDDWTENIPVAR